MYPPNTNPVHPKFIQNFPSQFPLNFPEPGNGQYIHSVSGHVTTVFPLGNTWEHPEFPKKCKISRVAHFGFPSGATAVFQVM